MVRPRHAVGLLALLAVLLRAQPCHAQAAATGLRDAVRAWREAHEVDIVQEFTSLLAIPNLASDSVNIRRNAAALTEMFGRRGFAMRLLELPGSPPAVFGELRAPGATRTVVLYAHYDGQPLDPRRWASPPWQPVLRARALAEGGAETAFPRPGGRFDPEARIYARSASDDKAPIIALLAALDALRAAGAAPSVNIKLFLEGEEEAGSPNLGAMLAAHRDLLRADAWLFFDGPVHQTRQLLASFGVRGVAAVNLTVYGASRPLHSGHYGNWAPNPAARLVELLATLRGPDGRITIDDFYADVRPLGAPERKAFAAAPAVEAGLKRDLGIAASEAEPARLGERIALPALNIDGLQVGGVGDSASNTIWPEARAYIDFRLVPDQTPERILELLERHLTRRGWHVLHAAPDSAARARWPKLVRLEWQPGYPAARTSLEDPFARAVVRSAERGLGRPLILQPTGGGSLPLFHVRERLGAPFVILPIANHDNNQHAENENLRLQNLWDGIELFAVTLAGLGSEWVGPGK
ncbi:MAG TPA: M20/M25/M40 family metallo-hydrolase [Gemmatimonadales bacterium]|nr:M20/M25/M40 family metallo-hydrolase [Gemmatimonadales bacterium]